MFRPWIVVVVGLGLLSQACISLPAELEPTQADALFAGDPVLVSSAQTCIKGLNRHVDQARESHFIRTVATSVSGGLAGTGGLIGVLDDSGVGTVGSVVAMLGGVSSLITSNLLDPSQELGAHSRGMQSFLAARRLYAEGDRARAEEALQNCWQDKETLAPEEKKQDEAAVAKVDRRATRVSCNGLYAIVDDEGLAPDESVRDVISANVVVEADKTATLFRMSRCVGDEVVADIDLSVTWSAAGRAELRGTMRYAEGDSCQSPPERARTTIERNLSMFIAPVVQKLEDKNGSVEIALTCTALVVE